MAVRNIIKIFFIGMSVLFIPSAWAMTLSDDPYAHLPPYNPQDYAPQQARVTFDVVTDDRDGELLWDDSAVKFYMVLDGMNKLVRRYFDIMQGVEHFDVRKNIGDSEPTHREMIWRIASKLIPFVDLEETMLKKFVNHARRRIRYCLTYMSSKEVDDNMRQILDYINQEMNLITDNVEKYHASTAQGFVQTIEGHQALCNEVSRLCNVLKLLFSTARDSAAQRNDMTHSVRFECERGQSVLLKGFMSAVLEAREILFAQYRHLQQKDSLQPPRP